MNMSQLDLSDCRKRKRGERVFKLKFFGEKGYPAELGHGSFEENVRGLLQFGQLVESGTMLSWSFRLEVRRHPLLYLFLLVVEETTEMSLQLPCSHCHYIGWGNHMVSNKKYHFLLPSKAGTSQYCKSNVIELQGDDHSLHGVFHSNGFGHLLCINGLENGSNLPGYQIMDFWDRLCTGLGARKVSLKDVSKKKGMDLRLIHTVAYGKPWFGRWDYTFGRGTYGVTQEIQERAVKAIRNIPLTLIANQLNDIQIILPRYQILSGHSLITLADLFHVMLELKSRIPTESTAVDSNYPGIMSDASCRWSPKRVEMAIYVVVEALKRAEFRWISRQHVRDVARAYIGDTGLLDFVLKSLGNHVVGKYFVRRCLNPVTKVLEYCLEETIPLVEAKLTPQQKISRAQLVKDISYMYKNILIEQNVMTRASRVILDSKYFIKDFCPEIDEKNKCKIYCTVILPNETNATPYHCFALRSNAIFDELRCEVEKTFREMYLGLRNFVVESIRNMNPKGTDLVFKTVKPGSKVAFEGKHVDVNGGIYGGVRTVDCICGTKDDDGERMVSCDICQVWQHTRCVQIPDNHEIPSIFLCSTCEQDILHFPPLP